LWLPRSQLVVVLDADVIPRPARSSTREAIAVFAGYVAWQCLPSSRSQDGTRGAGSFARRAPQLARDLLSVTFGSPSTPLSAGRLRMLLLFCFYGASGNPVLQVQISIAFCMYDRHNPEGWDG
jgi:hypothetical protein